MRIKVDLLVITLVALTGYGGALSTELDNFKTVEDATFTVRLEKAATWVAETIEKGCKFLGLLCTGKEEPEMRWYPRMEEITDEQLRRFTYHNSKGSQSRTKQPALQDLPEQIRYQSLMEILGPPK